MEPFVHLHVHTQYSLLDGQASIDALVDKAIREGMKALAVTDHGNMFGIKEFVNKVHKRNTKLAEGKEPFKAIIGCECYCARNGRLKRDGKEDLSGWHLIVLAKNLQGYRNLIKMVSLSWTEGFYGRPRIDKELLEKHHEGLIICSACLGGELPRLIANGRIDKAEESLLWFKNIFGEDYYLEIQRHPTSDPTADITVYPKEMEVGKVLVSLSAKHGVKLIASNDVHFVDEDDAEAHDRLICLSTGKDLDDTNRMRYTKQEWLKTATEMNDLFADLPEALRNTIEIADKVENYSIDNAPLMPDFPIPIEFKDADDYLRALAYTGAEKRYADLNEELRQRIDYELNVIQGMGFPGYFLIVQDFINAARKMGVSVGPGRGSVAGSVVSYCLGITNIDPLKYDLLFERFLNPDRISMPDIDVDFDDDGRGKVLSWVTEKYGKEKVAHIITYGTMAAKSAIKDVARVQRLPLPESNRLAKLIPDKIPDKEVNLRNAIEYVPELREAANSSNELVRSTLKYALKLEGNVRNTGVHACGVIIGKTDISDIVPVSTADDKETGQRILVTQYEGSIIEDTGLIKMDFLGLKTLSIIHEAIENIRQIHGKDIHIDSIPIDDPKTYALFCSGKTTGTFQFESSGMQKYLRELQPNKFEDLIAMNALYRPGPMEYIPQFIARKQGREPITYDIPIMERYLKDTYGITVYQEQVMLLARLLAGFTGGQSDELRKAIGKKLHDKMVAMKSKFLEGGKHNGHDENTLNKIWNDWEKFASYAFNKSHATCYSWIAYQTAWLKANYPSEYMAALLSRNISNITEITKFMDECRAMNIQVLGPDVNESQHKFSVNPKGDIRFGLGAIKSVGESAVIHLIEERKKGPFTDIFDLVERVNFAACNRKAIESLALAGALDTLGLQREQYFAPGNKEGENYLDILVRYGNKYQADKVSTANSLFGADSTIAIIRPPISKATPWSDLERLNKEKEYVGIYLSAHPLDEYYIILNHVCNTNVAALNDKDTLQGRDLLLGGIVIAYREGTTKIGKPFGVLKLEDFTGNAEISLFGQDYYDYSKYGKPGTYLLLRGRVESRQWRENEFDFRIRQATLLQDEKDRLIEHILITLPIQALDKPTLDDLTNYIKAHPGPIRLTVQLTDAENTSLRLTSGINILLTRPFVDYLENHPSLSFRLQTRS
ncbi:MAG: DNA polymerase III subunit alpha [Tannerellaceae bacterium]|jgi:DNA polymerase-3 subunit alpha|nr:DNA polymerase III subunit alpha [Tannerellaceae bacterium]